MTFTRTVVLEQGDTGWEKIQSIFSAVRMWGASVQTAYAVQSALLLTLAATLAWLWRSDAAFELKASALATASLLATPYVLDYDLVASAVAIAFFARHGLDPRLPQFRDQPAGGRLHGAAAVAQALRARLAYHSACWFC